MIRACRLAALLLLCVPAGAGDWPEFRGPSGQGISDETGLPIEWGPDKNIAWKAATPGEGWSSPIVWNGRVYLTAAVTPEGAAANERLLTLLCFDASDGGLRWEKTVFSQDHDDVGPIHGKNSHASPTPLTDGRHVFVHFGAQGTACLTLDGEVVWQNRELRYRPVHGGGNSPVLVDDLLFVNCDGGDVQFVAALDRVTGEIRWRKDRPPLTGPKGFAFSTPLVIEVGGARQIVSPAADRVVAYSPGDGAELWRFDHSGYSVVPRPVFGHGLVFFSSGFEEATLFALRPAPHAPPDVVWSIEKGAPHTSSPLLIGSELYFVSDRGVGTCTDARSGEVRWVKRLGGNYSASPVAAGGHIYFQNEDGGTVVVRSGTSYEEVARNSLPGRTLASWAVADSSIFLRTDSHLYRIERR